MGIIQQPNKIQLKPIDMQRKELIPGGRGILVVMPTIKAVLGSAHFLEIVENTLTCKGFKHVFNAQKI
jgi:MinD-like ATPase involved in chromosome partitioning or flagellar assembly